MSLRGAAPWLAALAAAPLAACGGAVAGLETRGEQIRLVALAVLLAMLLPLLFRSRLSRNLRNALVWAVLLGLLAAGYAAWRRADDGAAAVSGRPFAETPAGAASGETRIRANRRGEFVAPGRVDGVPVTFLVDTGASDVVLSRADARRVGFDPDRLAYTQRYATANGTVLGAPVRLREVAVGGVRMADVRGSVTDSDLGVSLLGMSFINRLSGFELGGGALVMRR